MLIPVITQPAQEAVRNKGLYKQSLNKVSVKIERNIDTSTGAIIPATNIVVDTRRKSPKDSSVFIVSACYLISLILLC